MRGTQIILGLMAFTFASGCGRNPQPNSDDTTAKAAAQVVRPPGVPTDATLITGAQRIRQMLIGKRLQPVNREVNFDQGDEYFRSDQFWEKRNIEEGSSPYLGFRIDWRDADYCVYYLSTKRCTSLWLNGEKKLFASHYYLNGNKTPVYEVDLTDFDSKKISERSKGASK